MSGRTLGYSLLGGAALLAVLMLAWLGVSGAAGGGIVLGLILLVVLAGPLAVAGLVVLRSQSSESAAAAQFASKRRILEADRLFRSEIAPQLRQLAQKPGLPAARLNDLAADLERSTYDSPDWYDAVQLSDQDAVTLRQYEDLVWDRVRFLRDSQDSANGVRELEQALDQRRDLLLRGQRAPTASPSVLMRAGEPATGQAALAALKLGDAVTAPDGTDYVVEGVATYFAEGQTWKLAHLLPSGGSASGRWLYIGPAALEAALLEEVQALPTDLSRDTDGTATVDVNSRAGAAHGILVSVSRYRAESMFGLTEDWPDGAHHVYAGNTIKTSDIEVWPAA